VNTTGIDISGDFSVSAPTATSADELTVRPAVDSPIDIGVLDWTPRLWYTSATSQGESIPVVHPTTGERTLELDVPADIDIYPNNTRNLPYSGWTSTLGRTVTVRALVSAFNTPGGEAVLTVKQRDELVAKATIDVPASILNATGTVDVDVTLANGEDYWFDISIRDPGLSDTVIASGVQLRWQEGDPPETQTLDPGHTRHWAGRQGIFPISYRGWGYAGYNGDGDRASEVIDSEAFVLDEDAIADLPRTEPTGFNDPNYNDPSQGDAYPFTPYQLDLRDADGNVTDTVPVWRGFKDNLVGGAGFARSSRNATDNPNVASLAGAGSGARAVQRIGIAAPVFALVGGIGPLSVSAGAGPSFGLLDYTDMNGDAFPDIVAPGYISYTGPRGGYVDEGNGVTIVNQDVTFKVGGGFNGTAVSINAN
jgi:hypothetical protein